MKKAKETKHLILYSDGGSVNNGKKEKDKPCYGSYCYIITTHKTHKITKQSTQIFEDVTNNQMELQGFIEGVKYIKHKLKMSHADYMIHLTVVSDSQYLIKGCSEWLNNWKRNGWKDSSKKPIKNMDTWKLIDKLINSSNNNIIFEFKWVRGHKGKSVTMEEDPDSYFNEMCDTLLSEELKPYR